MVSRRGIVLLELVVAFGLFAVLIALCLQMFLSTAAARRASERRAGALVESGNLVERAAALPWNEVTPERLADFKLSSSVEEILPHAVVKATLEPSTEGPRAKHVQVEITWNNPSGVADAPVRLSYWAYAPAGEKSP